MNKIIFIIVAFMFLGSTHCYATKCESVSGPNAETVSVTQNVAVLQSLAKGTKLWIGDEFNLTMACWQNGVAKSPENVHLYLNPADKANNMLGDDIEVGLTVNGRDLICSDTGSSNCKVDMGVELGTCNSWFGCKDATKKEFSVKLRPFVSKKSEPKGNKEGALTTVSSYQLLTFDGVGGVYAPANSYKFYINNLNNFRYVSCGSTLSISPKSINFGEVSGKPTKGEVIKEVQFSVSSTKQCSSVYAIGSMLSPLNGIVEDNILIPSDNDAVGIKILSNDTRAIIPYNSEFLLMEATGDLSSTKRFIAQLLWNKSSYHTGPFNAGASIDIYYR
ncbi:type 1 fimbria pilin [Pseudomonas lurida]